jgi:uncharacterized SAM-binding protein YcdF (DUF218 family)
VSADGFAVRKTIEALVMPLALVVWAFLGGWMLRRSPREGRQRLGSRLLVAATVGLVALSYGVPFDFIGAWLERRYPPITETASLAGARVVHVLGGDVTDRDPLPVSALLGPASTFRAAEGIRLHRAIAGSRLLFTGYAEHGRVTSADAGVAFAQAMGVPANELDADAAPRTTAEEVGVAQRVAAGGPIVLVTTALHMPRAMMLFRRAGLSPVAAPTGYRATLRRDSLREWIAPSGDRISYAAAVMHELLSILVLKLTG